MRISDWSSDVCSSDLGFLIAVVLASAVVALLHMPVETIGSRFPELPTGLPAPALPEISLARLQAVAPAAFTIAFLAGIEALLSAVVADGMIGSRHRSNQELVGQGVANMASAVFGGLPDRSEEHTSELQ